jgi:uroporphyrinogen decarboxylase
MTDLLVPLSNPRPDRELFLKSVLTDFEPDRPRMVEYLFNGPVLKDLVKLIGRPWVDGAQDAAGHWDNFIQVWYRMGYDFVRLEMGLPFPNIPSRSGGLDGRHFSETATGPIMSWADFEKYPWPDLTKANFSGYEYVNSHLPDGMGMISCHGGGPLEHVTHLMGYETLCLALYEQPDLVAAVAGKVGELLTGYAARLMQFENLIAYFQGDDMGFRSATLISPDHLRRYTLPIHQKLAALAHQAGRPYFLHSCGNVHKIMGDLIDTVRIDAKHSIEDAISPAAEWKRAYGQRIGILGGVDLDKLCTLEPTALRKYVRQTIDQCRAGGRFAIGSGNSIPEYVPLENYLTMIDEAQR